MLFIFQQGWEPANFLAAPAPDFFSTRLRLLVFFRLRLWLRHRHRIICTVQVQEDIRYVRYVLPVNVRDCTVFLTEGVRYKYVFAENRCGHPICMFQPSTTWSRPGTIYLFLYIYLFIYLSIYIYVFAAKQHLEQAWNQGQNVEPDEIKLEAASLLAKWVSQIYVIFLSAHLSFYLFTIYYLLIYNLSFFWMDNCASPLQVVDI